MNWQPIETAPNDKSVMLYCRGYVPIYCGRKRYGDLGEPQQSAYRWRCDSGGAYANPTHWMPLPAPPDAEQPVQPADAALRKNAERYAFCKTLEGQVVTMETFKTYGSAALDQALDDAMSIVATIDAAMKPAQQKE